MYLPPACRRHSDVTQTSLKRKAGWWENACCVFFNFFIFFIFFSDFISLDSRSFGYHWNIFFKGTRWGTAVPYFLVRISS